MSYFFGTAGNVPFKIGKRKHLSHRSLSNDKEAVSLHSLRHRRKHGISKKSGSKSKSPDNSLAVKSSSKHCLHKEITRLTEENRILTAKLDGTELNLNDLSIVKEKDESLFKLKKKYQKLEQSFYEMQVEHDKVNVLLAQRENEFRQLHLHHEEAAILIRNLEQERNELIATVQKFKSENTQQVEDVHLLKNLIYRLNAEIEKYQDKLRSVGQSTENQTVVNIINEVGADNENKNVLKSWGKVNFHALGPLLDAYEENINEKDGLILKYKKELDDFTGRVKEVLTENENLYSEIESLKSKYDKYFNNMKSFEKDTIIVKEQNDLLVKQASIQKQKLQEIHAVYEQKVESMSQDNNKLHKEYLACKTELSNFKGKYEILNEGYEKLKNNLEKTMPVSVHNAAVEECRRLFEELKQQYDSEKKKLNARLKHFEDIQPENEKQMITLTAERDQLRIQARNLEKNLKRTQNKLEHLQNVVQNMQVSRDSFKRQLSKTTLYCEELVKEQEKLCSEKSKLMHLLDKKEKENESIQYLGSNIAHRMGTLKSQLKIVQEGAKEQLASVERQIKNQELGVGQMKTEYQRELQRLKQLLRQKEETIYKLQKEKCATQDSLEMVWKAATSDNKTVKDSLRNVNVYNI